MRKKESLYNLIGTISSYAMSAIFVFITQAVLIKTLGIEYTGINGLFTNIITMLSVTELGVSTTIIYKLYKPISENDTEKIKSWMLFYKKCYNVVALAILVLGICVIPFLDSIVGEVTIKESIVLLYMIQIADTVLSYCMTYKRSLLYADQKNYIINLVHTGYILFMNITQIIILITTKNYVYYLLVKIVYRVLENIIINTIVNHKYKFIKEKAEKISKEERKDIFDRVKAIFVQKISFVVNKGMDNIIISLYLGVVAVGYYSNYFSVISAVSSIIYQLMSSFAASIGNLVVEESKEKIYSVYKKINMINSFITGVCVTLVACLIEPFICVWIGEEYLLSGFILISFLIYLYCDGIRRAITMYKEAKGICIEDKNMYLLMAIINIVSSVMLCNFIGMAGVILGTAISYLFLILFSYPRYVFKQVFDVSIKEYFKSVLVYLIYIIAATGLAYVFCSFINVNSNIIQLIINAVIGVIVNLGIFIIMFSRKKEFKSLLESALSILKKFLKRKDKIRNLK